jgi:hypothetical protein
MPSVEIQIDSPGTTVSSPHDLPFIVYLNDISHVNYPIFFKSLAARFATSQDLPSKMEIVASNLQHDPLHTSITFPIFPSGGSSFSCHFHSDFHVGDVSNDHTIRGYLRLHGSNVVQLPSQLSMLLFIDSQYM